MRENNNGFGTFVVATLMFIVIALIFLSSDGFLAEVLKYGKP